MRPALVIAKRELRENVVTWKLPLAFVLTSLLLIAGVTSLAASYRDAVDSHALVQDEYQAAGKEDSPEALAHRFLARPNALSLLVGGPAESIRASLAAAPVVTDESARERQDPMLLRFEPTDLASVGVGVLSLLAILVAYDGVSGEKERGTLKLLLINPLSRAHVLAGKYLGAMATLVGSLLVALLLAALALARAGVRFEAADYLRLLLILLALLLFLSAIVLAALAVSAMTTRSSVAILALTLLWLLSVAGAGTLAATAAGADREGRSSQELLRELRVLHASYDEEERALNASVADLESRNQTQNGTLSPSDAARLRGLREEMAMLERLRGEDEQALLVAYVQGRELDLRKAERYAAVSPAEAFRSASQRFAQTDYDAARARLDEFGAYMRETKELRDEHNATGTSAPFQPPALRSAPSRISADWADASPFLGALAAHNLVALGAAAAAFSRYDVR
ncbi:MAG TPA: ABC transporter permease subunit [Candidatus Thermoplasmatota archaeon]|nr:ABC transporter permease subunit [Candidatus Thermoplasmatota archaeon]